VLAVLREATGFSADSVIADVGSGTGISAELFLRNGNVVYGVEPNAEMRHAAEQQLAKYPKFRSVAERAEATMLADGCVDYVVAAQAFHWFDRQATKVEFARILKPAGWLVLMWNSRRLDSTPFARDYESLLQRFGTDYREVNHQNVDATVVREMFDGGRFELRKVYNEQRLDFSGLRGRVLSSSYMPAESDADYQPMIDELTRIFAERAQNGEVRIEYDTELYFGRVK
jgi:SAM-dependent methyltransferase